MPSSTRFALVASLISNVLAQTPDDFKPGTLVKLGVQYPAVNIDPVGSALQSLDQASTEPVVTIPTDMLVGAAPDQRFLVMMIDTDVIRNNVATTLLHWFQPDLIMETSAAPAAPPPPQAPGIPGAPPPPVAPPPPAPAPPPAVAPPPAAAPPPAPQVAGNTALVEPGMVKLVKLGKQNSITGVDLPPDAIGQVDYLPPGPPPGPPHRYVQVLFAQPRNFSVPACFKNVLSQPGNPQANAQMRVGFDINQFMAASGIRTRPLAGNYFRAQNPQPGDLSRTALATQVVNAMCPGVTPGAQARARKMMFRR